MPDDLCVAVLVIACFALTIKCGLRLALNYSPFERQLMRGLPLVLLFTAMTFLAWGVYGPTLHHGSLAFDKDSLRAFVGVGLAYFLIAVVIPVAIIRSYGESGKWTVGGTLFSIVAGAVGAVGALGIILALNYGGDTVYVMPVVFGLAPVVNTLVTATLSRTFGKIKPIFLAGIATVALGAVGVLVFRTPTTPKAVDSKTSEQSSIADQEAKSEPSELSDQVGDSSLEAKADSNSGTAPSQPVAAATESSSSVWKIIASMITAAICWGSYGPMLHLGQGRMAGSRLRPFVCVGIAYFLIAVIAPLFLIYTRPDQTGSWTMAGLVWSILAGSAGAIGALGVILAFNAGGKPFYVMPIIFGFAPVVNTFISLSEKGTWHLVHPLFWISLGVVIAGAVTVLITAPKSPPPAKAPAAS